MLSSTAILLFLFFHLVVAITVNRTIDDSFGDSLTGRKVLYLPEQRVWKSQNCSDCTINPDTTQTFDGTYTAATFEPRSFNSMSIEMQFTGTAIYVFFVLPNTQGVNGSFASLTAANFSLDGGSLTLFQHTPDSTHNILYNQSVYVMDGLPNTNHTLLISTGNGFDIDAYVCFDYAVYTEEVADTPPVHHFSTAAMIGLAIAGVISVTVMAAYGARVWNRQKKQRPKPYLPIAQRDGTVVAYPYIPVTVNPSGSHMERPAQKTHVWIDYGFRQRTFGESEDRGDGVHTMLRGGIQHMFDIRRTQPQIILPQRQFSVLTSGSSPPKYSLF